LSGLNHGVRYANEQKSRVDYFLLQIFTNCVIGKVCAYMRVEYSFERNDL